MNPGTRIPAEKGQCMLVTNTVYSDPAALKLLRISCELAASDTSGRFFRRSSMDNGRTWSDAVLIWEPEKTHQGTWRRGENCLFFDEDREALVFFFNEHLYPEDRATADIFRLTRIFYQVSFDRGASFTEPIQLIQKGCDAQRYARGVEYGGICLMLSNCRPSKNGDRITLPVQRPGGETVGKDWHGISWVSGCLLGEWREDGIEWDMGELVGIRRDLSCRGALEPTISELSDGAFLMVMRGSNARIPEKPGFKWQSISQDRGRTWGEPEPLTFATGESFFSPSSGSRLMRHSRNRKLYWIGNMSDASPRGNGPRYPLVIAEVDEGRRGLVRRSVRVIADRGPGDPENIQFSNFRMYEDRETGEFVVVMAHLNEKDAGDGSCPAYEHRVSMIGVGTTH